MSKAIKVENLSKAYQLGDFGTGTISRDLERFWARLRGKEDPFLKIGEVNDRTIKGESDVVWSLNDINFEVEQGDAVGIIGRNGAGKSTLLKILSRVTSPTTGSVKLKGRIASLLEVGTGFHPELSGRENIYLNGAILGMRKAEIKQKFDEIVSFSGVERYIDTPVKRYSSGMYVRLAFAVAAHLESEILIIDEVLAVGDAEFQKKCLGKMGQVSMNEGRTVLFVSHNMAAVKTLCNRGIVLANGQLIYDNKQLEAVSFYQTNNNTRATFEHHDDLSSAPGNENIRVLKFIIRPLTGDSISISTGISFEMIFFNQKTGINLDATFELKNSDEIPVFHNGVLISTNNDSKTGFYTVKCTIPPNLLNAGNYSFKLIFGENQRYQLFGADDFIGFEVENESKGSNSALAPGVIHPKLDFDISYQA
ncbi:ATP-binding cassette domain-containing protein [Mucilaginibacter rubeus]|uniref:ATP-binding cassette domain-containing protein n=1 Tax=Mucilaginibacter rubeus TaxID=2027860 RepID=A0AAE6JHX5_9SPHI|nr:MULTISPECIES: ABC transporter ATP-binding protein [Mucilaginibacter]QEM05783.1 ATP-binding cassette domain-containing protein [Mucilaginibacter rubeus]QEM18366.1 ATP-binding cassette domain-containing protein [Mucilaginibacter gossypii]QTE45098.1 ATP-binding cassette domain-containing protein [Mucilaginibacter rubeus]QTE51695.1 ATP-binding cassette domain-containing protein [Mucilaginibacter rubeus]QTE56781.1 ATP-binding cassette domain-containing protein [Mucilaginibacter rubeus]